MGVRLKELGRTHPSLKKLGPTNPFYDTFMSYCVFRCRSKSLKRSSRESGKIKGFIRRMEISMRKDLLSGEISIEIMDVLARFVDEVAVKETSKAQTFFSFSFYLRILPNANMRQVLRWSLLRKVAIFVDLKQYRTSFEVLLLLRTSVVPSVICNLRCRFLVRTKNPKDNNNRASVVKSRLHPNNAVITYIDGYDSQIRAIIKKYKRTIFRARYVDVTQNSKYEGDAVRARALHYAESGVKQMRFVKPAVGPSTFSSLFQSQELQPLRVGSMKRNLKIST